MIRMKWRRTYNISFQNLRRVMLDAFASFFICSSQSKKSLKASLRYKNIDMKKCHDDHIKILLAKDIILILRTYLQKTVGRNSLSTVWKSFSFLSLGSNFAVTFVEKLDSINCYHYLHHHYHHHLPHQNMGPHTTSRL